MRENLYGSLVFCAFLIPMGIQHAFDFITRILFDHKYDKYLGVFGFVLVSRNNEAIVCVHSSKLRK